MLQKVLSEIKASQGTIRLDELSRRIGVDRSALEGMIMFLTQKGLLKDDEKAAEMQLCEIGQTCSSGRSCPGPAECPFVIKLPKTYSLTIQVEDSED